MPRLIVIRAHGCTVKDLDEKINFDDEIVVFQCKVGEKIPYWSNIQDGALGFIKKCISQYPDYKGGYTYKTNEPIPKTLLSGINKTEYDTCYNGFIKWIVKTYQEERDDWFISNGFAVKWSLFINKDVEILHCAIFGSTDNSTLSDLINTLKEKFLSNDNVWIVPVCRSVTEYIVNNIDTPVIESSGHFSYKLLQKKELEDDILSAIERNDKSELNSLVPFYLTYLKNNQNTRAEDLKQKIINDYNGLNIPIVAEKILDLIDIDLFGENDFYDFV